MLETIKENNVVSSVVANTPLPRMVTVKQLLDHSCIHPSQITPLVKKEMEALRGGIRPGMRVAVTCGSRGIANIATITRAVVDFIKASGAEPFIVPAMGSHGGATAEGQRAVLSRYGVTERAMECPILSSMEVVEVGKTPEGFPAYVDRHAWEADGIVLCGRVKAHTAFHGDYESGVVKMAAIGLGKQKGAQALHRDGLSAFATLIPAVAQVIFDQVNIIGGVAVAENAFDQTFLIAGMKREDIFAQEPEILRRSKARMGCIFFDDIDVLVVDRIGKDISGLGMDPNVTGRYCVPYLKPTKNVQHIAVLDLTEASHGNCNGIGIADVTTLRLAQKVDLDETYPNAVTSTVLGAVRIPLVAASDKTCIQIALRTCNYIDRAHPRIVRICDTMNLDEIEISESMLEEALSNGHVQVAGEPREWAFNEQGNLW